MSREIHSVTPSDGLTRVVELICVHRISGVPVVDAQGCLVGLVSERDVLEAMHPNRLSPSLRGERAVVGHPGGIRDIRRIKVADVMVRNVITAGPDTDPLRLASIMAVKRIRRIPIVEGKRLVGIVSQGDVYQAIFQQDWRPVPAPPLDRGRRGQAAKNRAMPKPSRRPKRSSRSGSDPI
ncbi:MAG: CBS domain-containing protein [Candidatus Methylomirabilales bacterium]